MGDTSKINMGRRQHPVCKNWGCMTRVDAPGDTLCRKCAGREQPKPRPEKYRHVVRRSSR